MNIRTIHLKIKVKSLATEATIIRQETKKLKDAEEKESLYLHRILVVRKHSRLNNLAYGLIKRVPYAKMEAKCWERPDLAEVKKLAIKFGEENVAYLDQWMEDARTHLREK